MSAQQYLILAYAVGLGLLLGYAATLWLANRALGRSEKCRAATATTGAEKNGVSVNGGGAKES